MLMTDIVNCWNPYRDWSKEQFSAHYLSHPLIIHSWHQKELLVQSVPKSGKNVFFKFFFIWNIAKKDFFLAICTVFPLLSTMIIFHFKKSYHFSRNLFIFNWTFERSSFFKKSYLYLEILSTCTYFPYEKVVEVNSTREFASPSYILYTCSKVSSVLMVVVGDWPAKF